MATSTYSDTTNAWSIGDWILVRAAPGHQYRGDPDDLNANQRREYYVWERYRFVKDLTSWGTMHGQVAVGADLTSYSGTIDLYPDPVQDAGGFVCTSDEVIAHKLGTDIYRQEQTWEFWGTWATYDETALA